MLRVPNAAHAIGMSASKFQGSGVHFDNGYHSEGLARSLELVMQHQNAFVLPLNRGRQGLLQISTPTQVEGAAAAVSVREAFDRIGLMLAPPALA